MIGIIYFFLLQGTAKIAFLHHGNQSFADNSAYTLKQGDAGYNGNSFLRLLDTHEYYNVPVDIHISGCLTQSYAWGKNDNGLLNRIANDPIVWLCGGSYAENILPYVDSIANKFSMHYVQQVYNSTIKGLSYYDYPNVIWIPERVWKSQAYMPYSLIQILNEEYGKTDSQNRYLAPCVVLDDNALSWACSGCNPRKVYRMFDNQGNYVFAVFIQKIARDNVVWQNMSDPSNSLNQLLWNLHNDQDQEQVVIYGDDWEKAAGVAGWDFGHPGVPSSSYDANIAWCAQQDWVQPIHIAEAVKWWGVDKIYDTDPGNDPPSVTIDYATYNELNDWTGGTYDNWYNDFKQTQAFGCSASQDLNSNGINGDYEDLWKFAYNKLLNVKDNDLARLGWVTLDGMLYETAWHTGPGGELVYWGKNMWNHTRYGGIFAFASVWIDSLCKLDTLSHIDTIDVDGDGKCEYIIYNSKICAVFDTRGGRALAVFNSDTQCIVGNLMTYWGTEGDYNDGAHPGLFDDSQAENSEFTAEILQSSDTAILKLQEIYDAQGDSSWDITKEILLVPDVAYLEARYSSGFTNWVKAGVTPDVWDNLMNGYSLNFITGISDSGWMYAGYKDVNTNAKGIFLWPSGQGLIYHNLGKMGQGAELIELGGKNGQFSIYFYAGSGKPEVNAQGPGDREGPMIWGTTFSPSYNILDSDSVIVTTNVSDPSGVQSVVLHLGINNSWQDFPMQRDDGAGYDWNGNGQPDSTLYGKVIPPNANGTTVSFDIHAFDNTPYNYDSWDNNYGQNYTYTVGVIHFIMDGQLDRVATISSQNGDMHLFTYFYADSSILYIATESAGGSGGTGIFQNDHFIFVGINPDSLIPAPWNKKGQVGKYDFYLADENDNDFSAFFVRTDTTDLQISDTDTAIFNQASAKDDRGYLEGIIHLKDFYGYVPESLYIAVATYQTSDSGNLNWQVPGQDTIDDTLSKNEYLILKLTNTGIRQKRESRSSWLKFFPNPVLKKITMDIKAPCETDVSIKVFDIAGRKVFSKSQHLHVGNNTLSISLGHLQRGVYFMKINTAFGKITKKFVRL